MGKYYVGIDVDKKTIKVCLASKQESGKTTIGGRRTFTNNLAGFSALRSWVLSKIRDAEVNYVMEATGVYHEHLAYELHKSSACVHIVLPLKAKRYMQSLGIRGKNDKTDAKGLAMMGLEQSLEPWHPASKSTLELRAITRQIEILQEHRTAFKNQLEAALHSAMFHKRIIQSLEAMINQAEKQIENLRNLLKKQIEKDAVLSRKKKDLCSIDGVGLMTFAVVAAETDGFTLFNNQRQLVCYSGYDVLENQSGQRHGKTRISKKGNSHIRRIMHMAAWSVVKHKVAPFEQLYHRVYKRTNIKMKGYVAVQRKLLVMLYTLWKNNEAFDPNFNSSDCPDPKPFTSVEPEGSKNTVLIEAKTALDRPPYDQSPEAFLSVE